MKREPFVGHYNWLLWGRTGRQCHEHLSLPWQVWLKWVHWQTVSGKLVTDDHQKTVVVDTPRCWMLSWSRVEQVEGATQHDGTYKVSALWHTDRRTVTCFKWEWKRQKWCSMDVDCLCRYFKESQRCSECTYDTSNTRIMWSLLFWSQSCQQRQRWASLHCHISWI